MESVDVSCSLLMAFPSIIGKCQFAPRISSNRADQIQGRSVDIDSSNAAPFSFWISKPLTALILSCISFPVAFGGL